MHRRSHARTVACIDGRMWRRSHAQTVACAYGRMRGRSHAQMVAWKIFLLLDPAVCRNQGPRAIADNVTFCDGGGVITKPDCIIVSIITKPDIASL